MSAPTPALARVRPLPAWQALLAFVVACALPCVLLQGQRDIPVWFAAPVAAVGIAASPANRRLLMALLFLGIHLLTVGVLCSVGGFGHGGVAGTLPWERALADLPGPWLEALIGAWLLAARLREGDNPREPAQLMRLLLAGVLIPAPIGAFVSATAHAAAGSVDFLALWGVHTAGALVGGAAVLPAMLLLQAPRAAGSRPPSPARLALVVVSALSMVVTGALMLPEPFVVTSAVLVAVAATAGFTASTLSTLGAGLVLALLIDRGLLLPPPSVSLWGDAAYYLTLLGGLLPGVLLAATLSSRRRHLRELLNSQERLRSLYTRTPVMLHSLDAQGRILAVSRRWLETLGYEEHEVIGRRSVEFLTPESAQHAITNVLPRSLLDGGCTDVEYQMVTRDGRRLDVLLSAVWELDAQGRPLRSLAVLQDVTEKKQLAERSHYAEHDPLTGLPNRLQLQRRLEALCAGGGRQRDRFAVVFLDIDRFKEVNDTWGHEAGDELLRQVSGRLEAAVRDDDTVCRLAGDEFVVLLQGMNSAADAEGAARKLLEALTAGPCQFFDARGQAVEIPVSSSIGVALFTEDARDPQGLLEAADRAMYAAKRAGRNRVVRLPPPPAVRAA